MTSSIDNLKLPNGANPESENITPVWDQVLKLLNLLGISEKELKSAKDEEIEKLTNSIVILLFDITDEYKVLAHIGKAVDDPQSYQYADLAYNLNSQMKVEASKKRGLNSANSILFALNTNSEDWRAMSLKLETQKIFEELSSFITYDEFINLWSEITQSIDESKLDLGTLERLSDIGASTNWIETE